MSHVGHLPRKMGSVYPFKLPVLGHQALYKDKQIQAAYVTCTSPLISRRVTLNMEEEKECCQVRKKESEEIV